MGLSKRPIKQVEFDDGVLSDGATAYVKRLNTERFVACLDAMTAADGGTDAAQMNAMGFVVAVSLCDETGDPIYATAAEVLAEETFDFILTVFTAAADLNEFGEDVKPKKPNKKKPKRSAANVVCPSAGARAGANGSGRNAPRNATRNA